MIKIEDSKRLKSLEYSPFCQHSTYELQEMKRFFEENLQRSFIKSSQAPFASPILFVKKLNGALHFYVDYRKLNSLTYKD
jgi:hypothetical protein